MYKNNQLIPLQQYNLIPKVANTLSITNKLIIESNRTMVMEIFIKNPVLFVNLISEYYPLNGELLEKYEYKWDWGKISKNTNIEWSVKLIQNYIKKLYHYCSGDGGHESFYLRGVLAFNENSNIVWSDEMIEEFIQHMMGPYLLCVEKFPINWSKELIEKYEYKLEWEKFSYNNSLPWSLELIKKYEQKWNWENLSRNESLPWSLELIKKYEQKWNWENLSRNESLPWSLELLYKYEDKWNWKNLGLNKSLPWSIELISTYEDKWYWYSLSVNKSLPWSIELIDKFCDKWKWNDLSGNTVLPWSIELISKYHDRWWWYNLSVNKSLPWSIEFVDKFKEKWDWNALSRIVLPSLFWSIELLVKFKDKWCWRNLCSNKSIPWTIVLIEKFYDKIDFESLSWNTSLQLSNDLMTKFEDKWNWEVLSSNESLILSIKLIEKYEERLDWGSYNPHSCDIINGVGYNKNTPWSIEFMNKFLYKFKNLNFINCNLVWESLKTFIDAEMIEEILKKSEKKMKNNSNISTSLKKGQIEFPYEVVYKYRDWNDELHKRFVNKREIYMASPETFKDKLDCNNQEQYDKLTTKQIYDLYFSISLTENLNYTSQQHRKFARDWVSKSPLKDKSHLCKEMSYWQTKCFEREGILSLTANSDNEKMWNEYANEGKGFCIGYDLKELFNHIGGCGSVKYVEKLPIILPTMTWEESFFKRVYFKLEEFSFEEEYRAKKFWTEPATQENRRLILPKNVFKEIILGHNMSHQHKKEIIESAKKNIGDITIIERKKMNHTNLDLFNKQGNIS